MKTTYFGPKPPRNVPDNVFWVDTTNINKKGARYPAWLRRNGKWERWA